MEKLEEKQSLQGGRPNDPETAEAYRASECAAFAMPDQCRSRSSLHVGVSQHPQMETGKRFCPALSMLQVALWRAALP